MAGMVVIGSSPGSTDVSKLTRLVPLKPQFGLIVIHNALRCRIGLMDDQKVS